MDREHLFQGISQAQRNIIQSSTEQLILAKNEFVFRENDLSNTIYIIEEGELEVLKNGGAETAYRLALLKKNDVVGEMGAIDNLPRSASVRAVNAAKILKIPLEKLKLIIQPECYVIFIENLAKEVCARLRATNSFTINQLEEKLNLAETRINMGNFLCITLIILSLYIFSLGFIASLTNQATSSTVITVPVLLIFLLGTLAAMKMNKYPLSFYGLTTKNLKKSICEAILFTIPLLVFIVLVKWLIITNVAQYYNEPLFNLQAGLNPVAGQSFSVNTFLIMLVLYALFIPIQELICRGAIQSSLEYFLSGPQSKWRAILIANLLFSVTHVQKSLVLAALVFFPGLLWGWLYARHKSIISVSISHILLGVWTLSIVGISSFYHN